MLRQIGLPELIIIAAVVVISSRKIFPKIGFSKWISIFMAVPILKCNLIDASQMLGIMKIASLRGFESVILSKDSSLQANRN
jgi:hypothetical protein